MRTFFFGITTMLFMLATVADAGKGNEVKVPFLFTDDQAAPQSELEDSIKLSDALRKDPYLNAPMTRLEYLLTRMESTLNGDLARAAVKEGLREQFERARSALNEESIRGYARYSDEHGRIIAGYIIEGMGRPRSSMRDACNGELSSLEGRLPQGNVGFLLHNKLLGILSQKDHTAYTPMLQKLASHIVHRVWISSETEDGKVHHTFACQRTEKGGPITYDKFSFRLK